MKNSNEIEAFIFKRKIFSNFEKKNTFITPKNSKINFNNKEHCAINQFQQKNSSTSMVKVVQSYFQNSFFDNLKKNKEKLYRFEENRNDFASSMNIVQKTREDFRYNHTKTTIFNKNSSDIIVPYDKEFIDSKKKLSTIKSNKFVSRKDITHLSGGLSSRTKERQYSTIELNDDDRLNRSMSFNKFDIMATFHKLDIDDKIIKKNSNTESGKDFKRNPIKHKTFKQIINNKSPFKSSINGKIKKNSSFNVLLISKNLMKSTKNIVCIEEPKAIVHKVTIIKQKYANKEIVNKLLNPNLVKFADNYEITPIKKKIVPNKIQINVKDKNIIDVCKTMKKEVERKTEKLKSIARDLACLHNENDENIKNFSKMMLLEKAKKAKMNN